MRVCSQEEQGRHTHGDGEESGGCPGLRGREWAVSVDGDRVLAGEDEKSSEGDGRNGCTAA